MMEIGKTNVKFIRTRAIFEKKRPLIKVTTRADLETSPSVSDRVDINGLREADAIQGVSSEPSSSDTKPEVRFIILFTNDMHGKYSPTSSGYGGVAYLASLVNNIRKRFPKAMLIDVGDIAYNPPYSKKHHFEPMISVMNAMNYTVMELGNHEYQYGVKTMVKELVKKAKFPVINSNLLYKETNELPDGVKPYIIVERNGIKIAFVGVSTTRLATQANPQVGRDVNKVSIPDALKKYIPEVKKKGADVVIVLAHEGVRRMEKVLESIPEIAEDIDVVYAGHDHYLTEEPEEITIDRRSYMEVSQQVIRDKAPSFKVKRFKVDAKTHTVYLVEAGAYTKYLGFSSLTVDKRTKELVRFSMRVIPVDSHEITPDPKVEKVIRDYQQSHHRTRAKQRG